MFPKIVIFAVWQSIVSNFHSSFCKKPSKRLILSKKTLKNAKKTLKFLLGGGMIVKVMTFSSNRRTDIQQIVLSVKKLIRNHLWLNSNEFFRLYFVWQCLS